MKNVVLAFNLLIILILNSALIMAEDVPASFSKEDIKEFIAIMNELESSAQKVQAETERAALEKRKQEEIARIEIGAAKLKAQEAVDNLA
ncbi:MAG: hypothetical protein LBB37_03485, partial [Endomicrobium sp.]|nr:hypothetical protein [Endomicrobium sp.]